MLHSTDTTTEKAWRILSRVMDPEVPVLSVTDLGIIRSVIVEDDTVAVTITPTYTGCPAMDVISMQIRMELLANGFAEVHLHQALSPAWTTDWMSEEGKNKLKVYGIAPPNPTQQVCRQDRFLPDEGVQCPHCNSWHTHRISEFGSTACKSLYRCADCHEPFDYFKCH